MIKLIAFDLDGTVLTSDKKLTDETKEAFYEARKKNILLVPSTGRIISFIPKDIMTAAEPQYVICSNGATVIERKSNKEIYSACIDNGKASEIQRFLDKYKLFTEYYVKGVPYAVEGSVERAINNPEFPKSKHIFLNKPYRFVRDFHELLADDNIKPEKINLSYLPADIRTEVKTGLASLGALQLSSSISDNLEINSDRATKGQALRKLCEYLDINSDECMALGDNGNDLDMLSFAGHSVATANASDEAKAAARKITLDCDHNGAAKAIEEML